MSYHGYKFFKRTPFKILNLSSYTILSSNELSFTFAAVKVPDFFRTEF